MEGYPDPVLTEVRQIKAGIMREYGSLEAWHNHLDEERPDLERQGWKFTTGEELRKRSTPESPPSVTADRVPPLGYT
jgi:hypothetical protein